MIPKEDAKAHQRKDINVATTDKIEFIFASHSTCLVT